jgi:hypothetical protein
MATTRLLTKQALQTLQSDLSKGVKGVNNFVKDAGKELGKKELEHELGENFDPNKKDRKSVVSLLSTLFEHKPYATRVPSGFVDMQRRLGSHDSKVSSTIGKMPKAMQLPEKPKWRQMLDRLKEEQEEFDKRGGMNRKSKKKRRNKKKKRYTRRRVR